VFRGFGGTSSVLGLKIIAKKAQNNQRNLRLLLEELLFFLRVLAIILAPGTMQSRLRALKTCSITSFPTQFEPQNWFIGSTDDVINLDVLDQKCQMFFFLYSKLQGFPSIYSVCTALQLNLLLSCG